MTNPNTNIASALIRLNKRLNEMQKENKKCLEIIESNNRRNDECLGIVNHNNDVIACICKNFEATSNQIENLERNLIIIPDPIKGQSYNKIA